MNFGIIITDINTRAGTERAVSNLSNLLATHNHNVYIISIDSCSGSGAYELINGVFIIHLNIGLVKASKIKKISCYKKLIAELKNNIKKYDLDYIIGTYSSINILLPMFRKQTKTIGCEHFNFNSANKFHKLLRFMFYRKLDAVVVLTKQDAVHYSFINEKNLFVIPNSLSFERNYKDIYSQKRVISIGRLSKQKGFDILIDVVEQISKRISDWKFTIVGDGELREILKKKIYEKKLEDLIDIIPPTNSVLDIYNSASIYLMTSRWEGLPMVLLEAQACGLPIVSFDCPEGPASVIHNEKDGFLIDFMDVTNMVNKLEILMNNYELRKNFGVSAFEASSYYSPENVYLLWENLLKNI